MTTKTAQGGRRMGLVAVLVMMLASAAGPAAAVERGFYIAVDSGKFRFDSATADFDAGLDPFLECYVPFRLYEAQGYDFNACSPRGNVAIGTSSMSRQAHGYDLWVGYQLSHWFAVEGAYLEMGKARHSLSGTIDLGDVDTDGTDDGPLPLQGRTSFHTRGPAFAAVGNLELGDYFSLDARAGFFFADNQLAVDATVTLPDGPQHFVFKQSDSKTALFGGASANFWITPYYSLRAGFTAYSKGSYVRDVSNVTQYFIGIRYSYGY